MLAVALAFGLVFGIAGCRDVPEPKTGAEDDFVIEDADEIGALLDAVHLFNEKVGGDELGGVVSTNKNVAHIKFSSDSGIDDVGFRVKFPQEVIDNQYYSMTIDFELSEVTTLQSGEYAKIGFKSAAYPVAKVDMVPYDTHEVWFGTPAAVSKEGDTGTQKISLYGPNKAPHNAIWFTHNRYAAGGGTWAGKKGSAGPIDYKVTITKIVFGATAPAEPCCEDCDDDCEDCLLAKCIDECDKICCVIPIVKVTGGIAVHENFKSNLNAEVSGTFGGDDGETKFNAETGVATFKKAGALLYKFVKGNTWEGADKKSKAMFDFNNYEFVDIEFEVSNIDAGGGNIDLGFKQYGKWQAYGNTKEWNDMSTFYDANGLKDGKAKGKFTLQTWAGDKGSGGFSLEYDKNNYSGGGTPAASFDFKITNVTYRKGAKHTITFNSMGGSSVGSMVVLNGNSMGADMPRPTKPNDTFLSWNDSASLTGVTYTASTPIEASITLYAEWLGFVPEPFKIDSATSTARYNALNNSLNNAGDGAAVVRSGNVTIGGSSGNYYYDNVTAAGNWGVSFKAIIDYGIANLDVNPLTTAAMYKCFTIVLELSETIAGGQGNLKKTSDWGGDYIPSAAQVTAGAVGQYPMMNANTTITWNFPIENLDTSAPLAAGFMVQRHNSAEYKFVIKSVEFHNRLF